MLDEFKFFRNLEKRMQAVDLSIVNFDDYPVLNASEKEVSFKLTDQLVKFFEVVKRDRIRFVKYENGVSKEASIHIEKMQELLDSAEKDAELSDSVSDELTSLQQELYVLRANVEHAERKSELVTKLFFECVRECWRADPEKSEFLTTGYEVNLRSDGSAVAEKPSSSSRTPPLFGSILTGALITVIG